MTGSWGDMCQGQCHTSFVVNVLSKLFLALVLMPRFIARGRGYVWFVRVYKIPRSGIPHTSNAGCATLLVVFGECKYEHAGCATLRAWPLTENYKNCVDAKSNKLVHWNFPTGHDETATCAGPIRHALLLISSHCAARSR